jgi:hypothetical protein
MANGGGGLSGLTGQRQQMQKKSEPRLCWGSMNERENRIKDAQ